MTDSLTQGKTTGLIVAVAVIFPFVADHMGWWAAVLGTGQLSTAVLTVYTALLIIAGGRLLVRSTVLPKRENWIWAVCLVLIFPLASLALMYRLYWNPPAS